MATEYLSQRDAHMRLNGTVCMYDNVPVQVQVLEDEPPNTINVRPLGANRGKWDTIQVGNPKFSTVIPMFGYINYHGGSHFLSRVPERRQRQGLHINSIGGANLLTMNHGPDWFLSKQMRSCIEGAYPPVFDCIRAAREEGKSMAFHRDMCISPVQESQIGLFFQGRFVALYNATTDSFSVVPNLRDWSFITNVLEQAGVKV